MHTFFQELLHVASEKSPLSVLINIKLINIGGKAAYTENFLEMQLRQRRSSTEATIIAQI